MLIPRLSDAFSTAFLPRTHLSVTDSEYPLLSLESRFYSTQHLIFNGDQSKKKTWVIHFFAFFVLLKLEKQIVAVILFFYQRQQRCRVLSGTGPWQKSWPVLDPGIPARLQEFGRKTMRPRVKNLYRKSFWSDKSEREKIHLCSSSSSYWISLCFMWKGSELLASKSLVAIW